MSISAKIATNTIEALERCYNKFKDQILEQIYEDFLKNHIHFDDLKNQFINAKPPESIINNKDQESIINNKDQESIINNKKNKQIVIKNKQIVIKNKQIVIKNKCYAYIWKNGEKKQCCNKKSEDSQYCLRHLNNRFYGSINNTNK